MGVDRKTTSHRKLDIGRDELRFRERWVAGVAMHNGPRNRLHTAVSPNTAVPTLIGIDQNGLESRAQQSLLINNA